MIDYHFSLPKSLQSFYKTTQKPVQVQLFEEVPVFEKEKEIKIKPIEDVSSEEYKKMISDLELEVRTMKVKIMEMNEKNDKENEESEEKIRYLQKEIEELNEIIVKKDYDLSQLAIEYEDKVNEVLLENNKLIIENNQMKDKVKSSEELTNEKMNNFKLLFKEQLDSLSNIIMNLKNENSKLKRDLNEEITRISSENNKKVSIYEEELRRENKEKTEYLIEISLLKKEICEREANKEIEFKLREVLIKEEDTRKNDSLIKEYELKFNDLNIIIKDLTSRNIFLSNEIQKMKKEFHDEISKLETNLTIIRNEKEIIQDEVGLLSTSNSYLSSQNLMKDDLIKQYKDHCNEITVSNQKIGNCVNLRIDEISKGILQEKKKLEQELHDKSIENKNLIMRNDSLVQKNELFQIEIDGMKEKITREIEKYLQDDYSMKYLVN